MTPPPPEHYPRRPPEKPRKHQYKKLILRNGTSIFVHDDFTFEEIADLLDCESIDYDSLRDPRNNVMYLQEETLRGKRESLQ